MTRPHVAIFISSMQGGGAERIMCNLANAFTKRGISTDLVLARTQGPYLAEVSEKVRIIGLDVSRPIFALWPLTQYLRREQPQAMLSALDHSNLIAVAARRFSRVPIRHVVSQRLDSSIRPHLRREPLEILNYWLLGPGYRRADAVIAVSGGVARSLEESHSVPRELIHVVYNSVEVPLEHPREELPHPWLAPGGPPVVLGAGRLTRQKGFDTLIAAFHLVRNDRPARLVILGTGEDQRPLETLASELGVHSDVDFPGFVSDPWTWMRRSDVFVLSSRWEGLPGVLLQAMACGTRVVSTDCPSGPSEILENGRWGRLTPVDDATSLAEAILDTLDDPDPPPVANRAADFSPDDMVDQYLDVLGVRHGRSSD